MSEACGVGEWWSRMRDGRSHRCGHGDEQSKMGVESPLQDPVQIN